MIAFLSIKPKYAFAILEGKKRYEFRKVMFRKDIKRVVIYASSPYKKIVGYFEVGGIHRGSPLALWSKLNVHAGIDKKAFFSYFKDKTYGIAIEVKRSIAFQRHTNPQEVIPGFVAPQSFRYMTEDDFELIKKVGV